MLIRCPLIARNTCRPDCGYCEKFKHTDIQTQRIICALGNLVEKRDTYLEWSPNFQLDRRPLEGIISRRRLPRIDFVYGPLCEDRFYQDVKIEYERGINSSHFFNKISTIRDSEDFISLDLSNRTDDDRTYRVFTAFEMENSRNRKYMLASMFNAAALGYAAVVITGNRFSFLEALNIKRYMAALEKRQKWFFGNNVVVISKELFSQVCKDLFQLNSILFQ